MSNRAKIAVLYGVLSILVVGIWIGSGVSGASHTIAVAYVFVGIQFAFMFFAIGYSAGRDDQYSRRVGNPSA